MTLLHHRRHRDAVGDRPEELVDEGALVAGEALGRGRGEREDVGAVDGVEQLGEQPSPHLEQVVALVEDEHQAGLGAEPVEEGDAVGVQPVDDRGRGVVVVLGLGVEDGEGLVGQAGQRTGRGTCRRSRRARRPCVGDPLGLDRGVGGEHDGAGVGVSPSSPRRPRGRRGSCPRRAAARPRPADGRRRPTRAASASSASRWWMRSGGTADVSWSGTGDAPCRLGGVTCEPPCAAGVSVNGATRSVRGAGLSREGLRRPRRLGIC